MATRTRRKPDDGAPQAGDDVPTRTPVADRDPALLRRIYEVMVLTRAVEDRMVAMYRGGDLLGSLYTGHWHEAISVGATAGDGQLHGQGHLADRRTRRDAALRPAGPGLLQPPQPHPGQLPGGHGHGLRQ